MLFDGSPLALYTARILLAAVLLLHAAHAQVRSNPVHQNTGPLSDLSTSVSEGSRPVHESGRSVHEGSVGGLSGNAVRDSVTDDVRSGPVSELSAGPVTSGRPVSGGGTVTDASVGAVQKNIDSPLGEPISQPVEELGPLLQQLRALQPEANEPTEEAAQELPATQEEAIPEEQAPVDAEQPADNEEPAAEVESAAPQEESEEPAPDAEAEPPPDEDMAAPPAVDDPRDAAEPTPTTGIP